MIGKLLTLKAAAASGAILLGATGAAAATGSLPASAQRVAHETLAHVGVDVVLVSSSLVASSFVSAGS